MASINFRRVEPKKFLLERPPDFEIQSSPVRRSQNPLQPETRALHSFDSGNI